MTIPLVYSETYSGLIILHARNISGGRIAVMIEIYSQTSISPYHFKS